MSRLPAVDGLRAYAVIPVLLFHAGFDAFRGGFVGVDIFFVISGFVITRMIVSRRERGTFSFSEFYVARIRRLYPAILATVILSCVFAALLFSPGHLSGFASSALWTLAGGSNFHFWWMTDYWASAKWVMPLLHTWSLGVEIQFYLIWPALILLTPRKWLPPVIGAVFVVSLIAAELWVGRDAAAAFYLPWFRGWEFALGAALVFAPRLTKGADFVLAGGLLLGAYAVLFTSERHFPGIAALPACLATAMCIHASHAPRLGRLLDNPVALWLGQASYSIYLVHWPLIIFWRYYAFSEPDTLAKVGLVVVSILLAAVLHYAVERPIYRGRDHVRPLLASLAAATVFIATPAASMVSDGWKWRVSIELDEDSRTYGGEPCAYPYCVSKEGTGREVALTGDSHARMYFAGVEDSLGGKVPFSVWHFDSRCRFVNDPSENGLPAYDCAERLATYLDHIEREKVETVILAYRWTGVAAEIPFAERAAVIASRTREWLDDPRMRSVKRLILVLQVPEYENGQSPDACLEVPDYVAKRDCTSTDAAQFHHQRLLNRAILDAMREELEGRVEIVVRDPFDALCDTKKCRRMEGRNVLYSDEHHLSRHGARLVVGSWDLPHVIR